MPIPGAAIVAGTSRHTLYLGQRGGGPVEFSGEGSLLTVGPPGTGKSRGVAVWNLLECPSSMLVTDPKGQLARWSADHRRQRFGHDIAVLDPFEVVGGFPSASVNPLDALLETIPKGKSLRGAAEKIAHLLLPDNPAARDPAWRQGGRRLIITGLLYLAVLKPEECHLPGLHDVLWKGDDALEEVLAAMLDAGGPFAKPLAQAATDTKDALAKQPKAFSVFRDEAREAVSIYAGDEPCGAASLSSTVDFSKLLRGRLTLYLVLPPEMVSSHGRWMGVVVSHAIHALMQAREEGECLFLLDEFPNLGPLPKIRDAIAQLREKGLRVWMFIQEIAQLESVYGRPEALNLRNQAELLQVLGCRSVELADFIEKRGGQRTAKSISVGLPDPVDPDAGPRPTIGEIGVPVFPAAAVMEMPKGKQILVRHGKKVILADVALWTGG